MVTDERSHLTLGRRVKDQERLGVPFLILAGKRYLEDVPRLEIINTETGESRYLTHLETMDFVAETSNRIKL